MLAVTRLENVLRGNGYPVPTNPSTYYRMGLVPGHEPAHILQQRAAQK
jgi:hypothetical protein